MTARRSARMGGVARDDGRRWTSADYQRMRELISESPHDPEWPDIADEVGQPVKSCKRVAKHLGMWSPTPLAPTPTRNPSPGPKLTVSPSEEAARRDYWGRLDDLHVRNCLRWGGFCRAEVVNGRTVHVYPEDAMAPPP